MKIIGLDVGEKRIGVAKVDSNTRIAVPVGFVLNDGSEWQEIGRIARLNSTNLFVLGLPRSNEGNETKQSEYVRQFARTMLEKIPDAKIRFQDESLTSVEAESRLKQRGQKYEKGDIDAEAAAIILQDFVERADNTTRAFASSAALRAARPSLTASEAKSPRPSHGLSSKNESPVANGPKKSVSRSKILFTILAATIFILGGITGVLKIRDKIRADREEEYRRQEAEMVAEVFDFTIVPGETVFDVRKNLIEAGYAVTEVDAALTYDYDFDFLEDPREKAASGAINKSQYLEGYLYGETHEFYKDDTAKDVIEKFLEGSAQVFSENDLKNRYAERGLTLYEGVTLASIVQKESPTPEMPTVAQVFLTRLGYGIALGSDVTVSYALDTLDPDRHTYADNHAALSVDSCYNTRKYAGLPCGPIANPGLAALLAVAEPSSTSYLFFLTGDDGLMYYSYTQAEHDRNAALYCKELCTAQL